MKINWPLRLKNKVTLVSLITLTVTFVYTVLGVFDIVPSIGQDQVQNLLLLLVQFLVGIGVVVDPTTEGASDSNQAMDYIAPRKETHNAL